MTNSKDYQQRANKVFVPVFENKDITLEHGKGCYITDVEGKTYLDCAAGIAVASLGHGHTGYTEAIHEQLSKFIIAPGSFPNVPKIECAELLAKNSFADHVFFCNSGTEAVEGALKLAHKWGHTQKNPEAKEIIAFHGGFHGRSHGAYSCTYKSLSQEEFGPYMPGVHFAEYNDLASVEAITKNNKNICGIIVEAIQGESGVIPAELEFLQGLRKLCDEEGILLIIDEIQTGMGRTGKLFAYEHYGIEPDIMTLAKGLGGGFPVGAFLARKKHSGILKAGDHGSTYGGNALAAQIAHTVSKQILESGFLEHIEKTGAYLKQGLEELKAETNCIEDIRGKGLMIGIDTAFDIKAVLTTLLDEGLMATQAGAKTLRLTPPLIITQDEADEALDKIGHVLRKGDL